MKESYPTIEIENEFAKIMKIIMNEIRSRDYSTFFNELLILNLEVELNKYNG